MITYVNGNILEFNGEAIINTVNCCGVMGAGLALQVKKKWPECFKAYQTAFNNKQLSVGKMFVWHNIKAPPKYIINFPTKNYWGHKSKIEYIDTGLQDLVRQINQLNITSIAVPPLGCGHGGLDWSVVRPMIEEALVKVNSNICIYGKK